MKPIPYLYVVPQFVPAYPKNNSQFNLFQIMLIILSVMLALLTTSLVICNLPGLIYLFQNLNLRNLVLFAYFVITLAVIWIDVVVGIVGALRGKFLDSLLFSIITGVSVLLSMVFIIYGIIKIGFIMIFTFVICVILQITISVVYILFLPESAYYAPVPFYRY